MTTNEGSEEET